MDISNSTAVVLCTSTQSVATSRSAMGFGVMPSQFGTTAPQAFNFSGCSVNIYTGPVMTSASFERSDTYN